MFSRLEIQFCYANPNCLEISILYVHGILGSNGRADLGRLIILLRANKVLVDIRLIPYTMLSPCYLWTLNKTPNEIILEGSRSSATQYM